MFSFLYEMSYFSQNNVELRYNHPPVLKYKTLNSTILNFVLSIFAFLPISITINFIYNVIASKNISVIVNLASYNIFQIIQVSAE